MSQPPESLDNNESVAPLHGFHGDRAARSRPTAPSGLTVAVSRESGARGGTIARLVSKRLGWPVYDQEHLEILSGDPVAQANLMDDLSPACVSWFEARMVYLSRSLSLSENDPYYRLVRLVVALGARGEAVILGRGAGHLLPSTTTLHVRVIAPLAERVAYLGQYLRLPVAEAEQKLHSRDAQRVAFHRDLLKGTPSDIHQYDMILNTGHLGEETCAEAVVRVAQVRWQQILDR